MNDVIDRIIKFEDGQMNEDEYVALFQELIDNGWAWKLQGNYGRTAAYLIEDGLCKANPKRP